MSSKYALFSKILTRIKAFLEIFLSPQITFGQRLNIISFLVKKTVFREQLIRSVELIHTLKCNCRCSFCSNEKLSEEKQIMKKKDVLNAIDKLQKGGIVAIIFLGGESLVDPNFIDYVKYARSKNIIPLLQTNGTLLTEKKIASLARAGLFKATITLHDIIPEMHDKILKTRNAFKTIEKAIPILKKHKIKVVLKAIYSRGSIKSGAFDRVLKFAKQRRLLLNINPFMPVGKGVNVKNLLTPTEKKSYKRNLKSPIITAHTKTSYDNQCPAGHSYLGILPDGEILPCYFLPISVGNIKEISIKEARKRSMQLGFFRKARGECIVAMNKNFFFDVIKPLYSGKYKLPIRFDKYPKFQKVFQKYES